MLGFLDLECTDAQIPPEKGSILEVGILLTDYNLEEVASFSVPVRPLPGYEAMPDVVREMHEKNGLLADIEKSGVRRYEAELAAIDFLNKTPNIPPKLTLVGNSVWFDFNWIAYHMPKLADRFHRRIIDITGFNEMAKLACLELYKQRPTDRKPKHRALIDCYSSLDQVRFYHPLFIQPRK